MSRELAFFAAAVWLCACGGNGLRTQARAAMISREILVGFHAEADEIREREQRRAVERAQYQEDARAAVEEIRARWAPIVEGYNAVAAAHRTWVDWLIVWVERDKLDWDKSREILAQLVRAWDRLEESARVVDLDLPPVPHSVRALLETGGDDAE